MFLGIALASLAALIYYAGLLDFLELKSLDLRFQIRGPIPPKAPIVIVSIDQDSFDELQLPWPWPRGLHGQLIRKLSESKAKIIGFDVLFTEPKANPKEDEELAHAIRDAGNVILGAETSEVASDFGLRTTLNLPTPLIRQDALGYGPVNLVMARDSIVRSAQPVFSFQDRIYPSFAYRIYQKSSHRRESETNKISPSPQMINFRGPPGTFPKVPYYRILRDEIDPNLFYDKIVLIGAFAPSLHDVYPTPLSSHDPMAGVEVQANLIETLWANNPIVPISQWGHMVIFIVVCALTIWLATYRRPLSAFLVVTALGAFYAVSCVYLFSSHQLWVPMTPPLFGMALTYSGLTLNNYILEQRARIQLRATFSKYVSRDVVDEILEDREGLALHGKRRHITVLFADLRGFTSISEQIGPEQVVALLSDYLARVTDIIFENGGTVDKFMGDGVMAIFGAPKSHGNDAERAIKTGVELIEMVKTLAPKWEEIIGRPLRVGVGINSGDAVVGSIGSEVRSDFTAIGDTVNLASRLEALTKELGVPMLISEFTAAELKQSMALKPLRQVKVQGRDTPLLVYTAGTPVVDQKELPLDSEPYVQRHK
jgi:adenylate cyclase